MDKSVSGSGNNDIPNPAVLSVDQVLSLGFKARRLRISRLLTQQELAAMTSVSPEEVDLLEHNLPVRLDVKRRLFKELWARRANQ